MDRLNSSEAGGLMEGEQTPAAHWGVYRRQETECRISGFCAVGPLDGVPVAYVMGDPARAHLIAAAPDLYEALAGEPDLPAVISPLSWLKEAADELVRRGPGDDCDDASAYWEMITELQALHRNGLAACAKASSPLPTAL